jgi:hypothetical protein
VLAGTSGTVSFALSRTLTDSSTGDVIFPGPLTYTFNGSGQSAPLVANDDASLEPTGSYYTIAITPDGSVTAYTYTALINAANGASQTLGSLISRGVS